MSARSFLQGPVLSPRSVPPFPLRLGANAPRGLLLSVVGNDPTFRNLVTGRLPDTRGSNAFLSIGARGPGLAAIDPNVNGVTGMGYRMAAPLIFSMEALVQTGSTLNVAVGTEAMFGWDDNGSGAAGTHDRDFTGTTSGGTYGLNCFPGGVTSGGSAFVANAIHHVCATDDGTNVTIYVNGVSVGTSANGSAFTGFSLPNSYCVVGGGHDRGWWSGRIFMANLAGVCWTASEVAARAAAPFSMFQPVVRQLYVRASAAAAPAADELLFHPVF